MRRVAAMQFIIDQVEREIRHLQLDRRLFGITAPKSGDPRDQLLHRKRLRQIIVRSEREPIHSIVQFTARRQDEDATIDMRLAQLAQDFKAVDSRQHDVEHNQLVSGLLRLAQSRLPLMHHKHVMPLRGQGPRDVPGKPNFIFHNEDMHTI